MAPTAPQDPVPPTSKEVSRRDALKRIAIVGGAAWTIPAIQTVSMQRAYAMGGSPTRKCYSVFINKPYGCQEAFNLDPNVFKCLQGKIESTKGGCDLLGVSIDPNGDGKWYVTLAPGVHFVVGYSRTAGHCIPSPTPTDSTGIIEFDPGPGGGPKNAIQHIELTFCTQGATPTPTPTRSPAAPPPTSPWPTTSPTTSPSTAPSTAPSTSTSPSA
jgi:hypothetical protein